MWLLMSNAPCLCSVWEVVAAKHATSSHSSEHAVVVAYVSNKDPWSRSMHNSTLACEPRTIDYRIILTARAGLSMPSVHCCVLC